VVNLSSYSNTFFPICSFVISLFLLFIFFSKKNVENDETKIYSYLIICGFFESFLYVTLTFCVNLFYNDSLFAIFAIYNKVLSVVYVMWMAILLYYILVITSEDLKKTKSRDLNIIRFLSLLFMIIIFVLPIGLYFDSVNYLSNSYGAAINFLYFVCSLYLAIMIIIVVKNSKSSNFKGKFLPIYLLFVLITLSLIIRLIDPFFNITSNVFSFVLLVMYHTIENPDLKLVNELELAKKNAERANMAKTEFLSSMSHEIRTPLNAIVGFSNSILEDKTLKEAQEEAKDIIMASQNLLEIVNGILDISKIEAGKMEIVNVDYKFVPMCNDIVKLVKPRIEEKPIELNVNFSSDIPAILYGDQGKVKEVITNLLTNACKYTEKGIINLEVSCINQKDISKLVISVEDTGRGIKSDKIDKLFTKFNRLDEDKNTTLEGTGLGLAITKSLVEMMGGKIIVQSKYGSGSKFTVYLSQKIVDMNNDIVNEEKIEQFEKKDYSNKKILVVDDNNLNVKVAIRLLKKYNIIPDCVLSGFECLEKVKDNTYDLILMDDMMPKMSGVETFHKLKENSNFKTPVVILTANAISGMKENYLKEGLDDYLAKPIDKLELDRVLNEFLNKK